MVTKYFTWHRLDLITASILNILPVACLGIFFSCFLSEILFVVSSTGVCKIISCLGVTPSRPSQANREKSLDRSRESKSHNINLIIQLLQLEDYCNHHSVVNIDITNFVFCNLTKIKEIYDCTIIFAFYFLKDIVPDVI